MFSLDILSHRMSEIADFANEAVLSYAHEGWESRCNSHYHFGPGWADLQLDVLLDANEERAYWLASPGHAFVDGTGFPSRIALANHARAHPTSGLGKRSGS